jgi:hypothetical protein
VRAARNKGDQSATRGATREAVESIKGIDETIARIDEITSAHSDFGHLLVGCPSAANGHAAAKPPMSVMNLRRLMSAPTLGRQHYIGSNEYFDRD